MQTAAHCHVGRCSIELCRTATFSINRSAAAGTGSARRGAVAIEASGLVEPEVILRHTTCPVKFLDFAGANI